MKKKFLFVFMLYCLIPILALTAKGSGGSCKGYESGKQLDFEIESFKEGTLVLNVWSYVSGKSIVIEQITVFGKRVSFTTSSGSRELVYGVPLKVTIQTTYRNRPSLDEIVISAKRC